jgi:hypothetical protein
MYVAVVAAALSVARTRRAPAGLDIRATDFTFEAPESIRAGTVVVRLRNDGLVPHHAWLVRLDQEHTLRDLERELAGGKPLPSWVADIGGPNAVPAGSEGQVIMELGAGHYVILCPVRLADGMPALMKGMYRPLEVSASSDQVRPPRADGVLALPDRSITVRGRIHRGRQLIQVSNTSAVTRELRVYRLGSGGDIDALRDWLGEESGPPPAEVIAGVIGLGPGVRAVLALDLERGEYALVSQPTALGTPPRQPSARVIRRTRIE